jgi:hypothetical protein
MFDEQIILFLNIIEFNKKQNKAFDSQQNLAQKKLVFPSNSEVEHN